ncbi:MAG TPA: complex I NDUFA9 subunit family protein [Nitrospirota bacterium]|nr:complex I NDUFA9 subunit family protein [Nitrospirota bacterium]
MILVTGGTGFVGSHLIRQMRKQGLHVRALVRNPEKAKELKDLKVELIPGDIADREALDDAAAGVERVIHLVGIIQEAHGATFQGVHVEGTRNLLAAAKKAGVRHFLYQSALGTRPGARSEYHKTKWQAEELVRASGIPFTILRPSLIYGSGDQFTLRLAEVIRQSPVLPVIGSGKSKVQPIYIDDVVSCLVKAVTSDASLNEIYEIGGPEQLTYEEVTVAIAEALGIKRPTIHMPLFLMRPMARVLETVLPKPPLTTEQLIMLQEDNVCGVRDICEACGNVPVRFRDGLKRFLGRESGA